VNGLTLSVYIQELHAQDLELVKSNFMFSTPDRYHVEWAVEGDKCNLLCWELSWMNNYKPEVELLMRFCVAQFDRSDLLCCPSVPPWCGLAIHCPFSALQSSRAPYVPRWLCVQLSPWAVDKAVQTRTHGHSKLPGNKHPAFLDHLSTKCSWWAIVTGLCSSSVVRRRPLCVNFFT